MKEDNKKTTQNSKPEIKRPEKKSNVWFKGKKSNPKNFYTRIKNREH